jgi:hypothetical protein
VDVAALVFWIVTAGGGFYLLATWISHGGARRTGASSNLPPPVVFGHLLLAAVGLVLWIAYVATDNEPTGWIAFVLLAVVALLGFTMFARWIPTYRNARTHVPAHATIGGGPSGDAAGRSAGAGPAERHFPVLIVGGHGLLAATTLVLVLLTMLGVGGS